MPGSAFAIRLTRVRRRKPWGPWTWVFLACSVAFYLDAAVILAMLPQGGYAPTWVFVLCEPLAIAMGRFYWFVFTIFRREDER